MCNSGLVVSTFSISPVVFLLLSFIVILTQRSKLTEWMQMTEQKFNSMCALLLTAIERSGSGPPKGIMSPMEYNANYSNQGDALFRAVLNHMSIAEGFADGLVAMTMPELEKRSGSMENMPVRFLEDDGDVTISKVSVNPLMLFLHIDQGSFANGQYTPFASPISNNRSIHQEHVSPLCEQLKQHHNVISPEDFAIAPYEVFVGSERSDALHYRCTLNRDRQNQDNIVAKQALLPSFEMLSKVHETVSFIIWVILMSGIYLLTHLHRCLMHPLVLMTK